eukprot:5576685-Pyramimonas_sp.AAC.1
METFEASRIPRVLGHPDVHELWAAGNTAARRNGGLAACADASIRAPCRKSGSTGGDCPGRPALASPRVVTRALSLQSSLSTYSHITIR